MKFKPGDKVICVKPTKSDTKRFCLERGEIYTVSEFEELPNGNNMVMLLEKGADYGNSFFASRFKLFKEVNSNES